MLQSAGPAERSLSHAKLGQKKNTSAVPAKFFAQNWHIRGGTIHGRRGGRSGGGGSKAGQGQRGGGGQGRAEGGHPAAVQPRRVPRHRPQQVPQAGSPSCRLAVATL